MLTSVTFILLLCYSAVLCNSHGVFWTILDKHVIIGHDLSLYCNESSLAAINCCPKHSNRRWFGGPNRELLSKNGISFYPSKYTSRLEDGGFFLTIHDVEEKDLNVSYACSIEIYEYTNILLPKYDTAESPLSTEISISTKLSISGSTTVGQRKGNSNERNDELTYVVIFIAIFLVLFIVVAIVGCHKRIKKLLMGILHSNDASKTLQNGTEDINIESEHLIEVVTTTENTDQNNRVEPVHSNDASTTLQNGTEDANMESDMSADKLDTIPVMEIEETQLKPVVNESSNYSGGGVKKISKSHVDQDQYTVNSGIAVIINNIEFDRSLNLADRIGSDVDASSLFQRFQELGFDSNLFNDVSDQDIREKFNEIKEDKKTLKDTDCLVVVLLTHGNEDHVFATDRPIKIKRLMDHFSAENCPELSLKPKVFIFQACRGGELGRDVRDKNQDDAGVEFTEYDEIHEEMMRIPIEVDFLAVFARSSGYGPFRSTERGSPFVRHLSEELCNMRKGENFDNVLTRVNRKVGAGVQPIYPLRRDSSQMPNFISHLTKKLVLKP